MKKQFRNIKELPGCPIGRIFKEDVDGDYYHSMSDDEAIGGEFYPYKFPSDIMENTEWFEECEDTLLVRSYDINNLEKYTLIDTGIANDLVYFVEKGLKNLNGNLTASPMMLVPNTTDISWSIIQSFKGGSRLKYKVIIEKMK